ncbi:MAG: OsmC family protein [Sphaerochaeta sp.]|nr:OsmC family protein [Sphaerochaeta sp.]
MANVKHIRADFVPGHWQFVTDRGKSFAIESGSSPYDYLFGALSGCLFSTFADLARKMKVAWEHVSFEIDGEKRSEVPTTLDWVTVKVTATGADDQAKFTKAFETATRYCSIYTTISKVARMEWSVTFA